MEHIHRIHEPETGLDGLVKCRICGQILTDTRNPEDDEVVLAKVSSARMANRILDEIAIKGGLQAESYEGDFIVYAKDENGTREEVTARKKSDRVYLVIKKYISKT